MAILMRKLKTLNPKKALAVVLLAGLTAFLGSSSFVSASGPQFNIFPISYTPALNHDLPLLDGRNVTRNEGWSASQSDHDAGVSAAPGDTIELSIYYHNGSASAPENAALNAFVQAFASPSLGTPALTHTISASIGAQNAATVSSSDPSRGGNIVVHIEGAQGQSLSLVPGSVTWFKEQGSNPQTQALPDTIFTSGENLGTIAACFEHHGFVNFKLRVSQTASGNLQIQKNVRNVTQNTSFNDVQVAANPGDTVEYQVLLSAAGNPVQNVFAKDAIDPRLSPTGSVTLDGAPITSASFFSSSGASVGTVNVGANREIRFQAIVGPKSQFGVGTTILTNVATAFTGTSSVSDGANVSVTVNPQVVTCTFTWDAPLTADGTQRGLRHVNDQFGATEQITGLNASQSFNIVKQHVAGSPTFRSPFTADAQGNFNSRDTGVVTSSYTPGDYNVFVELNSVNVAACKGFRVELPAVQQISLNKQVKNDNTGTIYADQADAQPGERVSFQLTVSPQSSNTALQNVVLRDTLPAKLLFVTGSLNVNGTPASGTALFNTGLSLGSIQPGSQTVVTFQADVADAANFTADVCEILTNNSTVTASGNLTDSHSANVRVCKQAPVKQPGSPAQRPF